MSEGDSDVIEFKRSKTPIETTINAIGSWDYLDEIELDHLSEEQIKIIERMMFHEFFAKDPSNDNGDCK